MKTLIVILIISSFLQSTILPINLVLIILISQALIRPEKTNLILAFSFGLLISHLQLMMWGPQSLSYLVIIQLTQILSKSRLAGNLFLIVPISLVFLSINQMTISYLSHQTLQLFPKIIFESFLSLPMLYVLRLWEERFIIRKEIKLRV